MVEEPASSIEISDEGSAVASMLKSWPLQSPKTPYEFIESRSPGTSTPSAGFHRFLPPTDSQPSPISTLIPTLPPSKSHTLTQTLKARLQP